MRVGRVRFGRMCFLGAGIRVFPGWRLRWLVLLLVVLKKERRWRRYEFGGLAIGVGRLRGSVSWKSLENVKMMIVVRIGAAMKFARFHLMEIATQCLRANIFKMSSSTSLK